MISIFYFLVLSLPLVFWNDLFLPFDLPKAMLVRGVVLLLFCLILVKNLLQKKITFVKKDLWLWIAIGGFFVSALLSTVFSENSAVSFWGSYYRQTGFLQMIFYFLLFILTIVFFSAYKDKKVELNRFVKVICIGGILTAIFAVFKAIFLVPELRISGSFGQTNFLATYLLMTLPLAVNFFLQEKKQLWQNFWLVGVLVILMAMFLTLSRAMFLGIGGIGLFLIFWYKKYSWLLVGGFFAFLILLLNIFKDASFIADNTFLSRFVFEGWAFQSVQTRFLIWERSWEIFKIHPVFGHGPEMLAEVFKSYIPTQMFEYEQFNAFVDRAHNEVIETAVTQGFVGVVFYFSVYFAVFRTIFKNARKDGLMVACLASLVALFFANLFSFSVVGHSTLWWLILAVIVCYCGQNVTVKFWEKKIVLRFTVAVLILIAGLYSFRNFVLRPVWADYLFATGDYSHAIALNPHEPFYVFASVRNLLAEAENAFDEPTKKQAVLEARDLMGYVEDSGFKNTGEYWFLMARINVSNGNLEHALQKFETASTYYKRNNEIYWHWGFALKAMGDNKGALEKFEKYLELVPFWTWIDEIDQKTPAQKMQFIQFFIDNNQVLMLFDDVIDLAEKINDTKAAKKYRFYRDGILEFQNDYYSAKMPA